MLNRILLLPGVVCLIHQLCRELVDSVFELYYDGQLHSKSRAISLKERQCTCMYMYLHVHDASIATHAVAIDCSILLSIQVHTRTNSYTRTREIVSKCRARVHTCNEVAEVKGGGNVPFPSRLWHETKSNTS